MHAYASSIYLYISIYLHAFQKNLQIVMTLHESRHCETRALAVLNFPSAESQYPEKQKMRWMTMQHATHAQNFAYPQSISIALSLQWNHGKKRQTCPASSIIDWMVCLCVSSSPGAGPGLLSGILVSRSFFCFPSGFIFILFILSALSA